MQYENLIWKARKLTAISPLKIGLLPQKETNSSSFAIHFQRRTVSFREGGILRLLINVDQNPRTTSGDGSNYIP